MKAVKCKVFNNRNIYSHRKCIRLDLDMEGYEKTLSKNIDRFNEVLLGLLPEVNSHRCCCNESNGFVRNLKEGTYLHHICGHVALALQNMVDVDVSFNFDSDPDNNVYYTVYEYKYENTGVEAGTIAAELINAIINKTPFNLESKLKQLKETLSTELPSEKAWELIEEAKRRGIPVLSVNKDNLLQFGYGRHGKIFEPEEFKKLKNTDESYIAYIYELFFNDIPRDFPLVAVTGTNGKTTTTRLIGYMLSKAGYAVGMTTTGGIYIKGQCVYEGDTTGPKSAISVLLDNTIDAAVLETARGGIIRDGLAYDLADVAVITNIADDHLGLDEVESLEELASVKALVGEAVKPEGYTVINGDDPMSLTILDRFKNKYIIFSKDKNNKALRENIERDGYGIYTDQEYLFIQKGTLCTPVMRIEDIGITMKGTLVYNIENAMAACAAAVGLGIDAIIIRDSLEEFKCNGELNPGRFNIYDINGVTAVLDYGHNIDGYRAVLDALKQMNFNNIIGVIGVPGDRLDRNVIDIGKISGNHFDYIFIKEDKDKRGRLPGEIAGLLQKGVMASGFNREKIKIIISEEKAFSSALDIAEPGDAVIVFFEDYEPLLRIIEKRISNVETVETFVFK